MMVPASSRFPISDPANTAGVNRPLFALFSKASSSKSASSAESGSTPSYAGLFVTRYRVRSGTFISVAGAGFLSLSTSPSRPLFIRLSDAMPFVLRPRFWRMLMASILFRFAISASIGDSVSASLPGWAAPVSTGTPLAAGCISGSRPASAGCASAWAGALVAVGVLAGASVFSCLRMTKPPCTGTTTCPAPALLAWLTAGAFLAKMSPDLVRMSPSSTPAAFMSICFLWNSAMV